ncbi:hypothetical protein AVEN_264071-1 [Araneus ventricosus]|uniref:Uncharacterized protein n=1 Tax=Araneus ventricosus TaxID=182803 RepID=A0A4Y2WIA6_ARAVE|nr:hypothetical protein AVEN_264071-1 [Araneus ventricosus]
MQKSFRTLYSSGSQPVGPLVVLGQRISCRGTLVKSRSQGSFNPDSNFSLQQACHKFVMTRVQVCHKFVMTRVQVCHKFVMTRVQACSKLTKAPKSP